jgi:hypothetical protein
MSKHLVSFTYPVFVLGAPGPKIRTWGTRQSESEKK